MSEKLVLEFASASPEETQKLGRLLGQSIRQGVVIGLIGELGAGKTTFTQGLAAGLQIAARVTSPTFTLINEYAGPEDSVHLFHLDSYRLADEGLAEQAYGLGLEEIFDAAEEEPTPHVVVIEWADRLQALLPGDCLLVHLRPQTDGAEPDEADSQGAARTLAFCASGPRSRAALSELAQTGKGSADGA